MKSLLALFDKPDVQVRLTAASAAEHRPVPGLVVLELGLSADKPVEAVLRLEAPGQPRFEKPLPLSPEARSLWLALHGHLLPNGTHPVKVEVRTRRGAVLAERTLALQVRNEGAIARQVAESLKARRVPFVVDGACDSGLYDYADPGLAAWFDRSAAEIEAHLAGLAASGGATPEEIEALRQFTERGYLVLPDVVDPDHLGRLNAALDDAVARKVEGYEWGASQRLHNLHHDYPAIRELWLHPRIMRMLELIFGEPAQPCQSLTYVFGSEQQYHQDTIHLTPFPAGRMCGVWTALEDVQPNSGELVVFPGSHRAPRIYMKEAGAKKVEGDWTEFGDRVVPVWTEILEKGRYPREVYQPKAGTVLIWHENLMHAGQPRKDRTKSRRSIVGHYFARGSVVYYDSSGMPGAVYEPEPA